MNFLHIPEFAWSGGYCMALGIIVVSAVLPLVYFRRRGWL
jgi:magnesium transporter